MDHDPRLSGYAHFRDPGVLAQAAAQRRERWGVTPIIVLTQPIVRDSKPVLQVLGTCLQDLGVTGGTQLHSISLLEALSTQQSADQIASQILNTAKAFDGLIFIGDAYRHGYDSKRAMELLSLLTQRYQQFGGYSPLVIKMPPETDQQLLRAVPRLWEQCLHLGAVPIPPLGQRSQEQPRKREETPPMPRVEMPRVEMPQVKIPEAPRSERTGLWYRDDPRLREQEYDGLVAYLKHKNLRCDIQTNTAIPTRYRIFLRLMIRELGVCDVAIVYDANFGWNNRSGVRVAIRSQSQWQLNNRLARVEKAYDPVCNTWLYKLPMSRNAQSYGSTAAAVFDALILSML